MAGRPWQEVADVLLAITPICTSHDKDGIDLYFLNHRSREYTPDASKPTGGYYNIDTPEKVQMVFQRVQPQHVTPTGQRLGDILNPYIARFEPGNETHEVVRNVTPINIIVITDGKPTDDPESIIAQCAGRLDKCVAPPHQVGIQFFQIGTGRGATKALRELDDELRQQEVRDMVDTVTWDGKSSSSRKTLTVDGILKVVLGAVNRRLDRMRLNSGTTL